MGANTTAVNNNLTALRGVLGNMLDTINEVNMKDWVETDVELGQLSTTQTTFTGTTNPTNVTATKTSSTAVAVNTVFVTLINSYKALDVAVMPALEALRNKEWTKYAQLRAAVVTAVAAIDTAAAGMQGSGSSTTATQGADLGGIRFVFAQDNNRNKGVIDRILPMLDARAEKKYALVHDIYKVAKLNFDQGSNDSITNITT